MMKGNEAKETEVDDYSQNLARPPSTRCDRMNAFIVMDIMEKARKLETGEGFTFGRALHLEVGQPSCAPPEPVMKALTTLQSTPLGYTTSLGLPE